jgi:phosphoenolpyruvate carboxykinase (GTP)
MLIPPEPYSVAGWKVWTVGDDICWLHPGEDGRLYAINPEAGYFGVAPGTVHEDQSERAGDARPRCDLHQRGHHQHNEPWWEDLDDRIPALDWKGNKFDPTTGAAAHPNSRFTVSMSQCPSYTEEAENPKGVPIDAIIFGGRRATLAPWSWRRATGPTAPSSVPRWPPKPPLPRPARSASCAAIRWP